MKVDLSLAEKRLIRKEEKIIQLEKMVTNMREKQKTYESTIKILRDEFIKVENNAKMIYQNNQA